MRLLLDTHALLWWLGDDAKLGRVARSMVADPANEVLVSVVSLWEIAIKSRIGKLKADVGAVEQAVLRDGFQRLPITAAHLSGLAALPQHHRDPFDQLLVAQAVNEGAMFVSEDRNVEAYPVRLVRCSA